MSSLIAGPKSWSMTRDNEGHREYHLVQLIRCEPGTGPASILFTPGLPRIGDFWNVDGDIDLWAHCQPHISITPVIKGEKGKFFEVEQIFSTKPINYCSNDNREDPLLVPPQISGSFTKKTEEGVYDRHGKAITNSSLELIRGPENEWEISYPTVQIVQNLALLNLPVLVSMLDTLNAYILWDCAPRTIKLSTCSWEKKYHSSCSPYYTRTLGFEVNFAGFDRDILDEGTKVLHGHWDRSTGQWMLDNISGSPPDPTNPIHFDRYKDRYGNPARIVLDGAGQPFDINAAGGASVQHWCLQYGPPPDRRLCFEGTAAAADARAIEIQNAPFLPEPYDNEPNLGVLVRIYGPYDDHTECADACPSSQPGRLSRGPGSPGSIFVEYYFQSDFLALGIPISL